MDNTMPTELLQKNQRLKELNVLSYNYSRAQRDVRSVLGEIVRAVQSKIRKDAIISQHLVTYSTGQTSKDLNEVNNLFFSFGGFTGLRGREQEEPRPLLVDSLLPISADIDQQNLYKKSVSKAQLTEESVVRWNKVNERKNVTQGKEPPKKLQLTEPSQQDVLTKQMRRESEEDNAEMQVERKQKERLQRLRWEREKKAKADSKIGYDYNGQALQMKIDSKKNLVAALLNGNLNENGPIKMKNLAHPVPITVEGTSAEKIKLKKFEGLSQPSKRKEEVEFSNVKTLADNFKTVDGVRYTYQGKTYEERKRVVSNTELKKTLSQRRISKDEYRLLTKLTTDNREDTEQGLKKSVVRSQSEAHHLRTQSEIKVDSARPKKGADAIHINDANLKVKMLEKNVQIQEPQERRGAQNAENGKIKMGTIDNFNLEYIRTGGSLHANTSRQFFSNGANQLPKIAHTTLYSKTMPKGRERIKQANEILRQMRKRFEQKLRV